MEIFSRNEETICDDVHRFILEIKESDKVILGYVLESLEGWCNYTTPAQDRSKFQIDVMPDFYADFQKILAAIQKL